MERGRRGSDEGGCPEDMASVTMYKIVYIVH